MRGLILLGLCALSAVGCSQVLVKAPVGDSPLSIEASEWEGDWLALTPDQDEFETISIKVADADRGMIRVFVVQDGKVQAADVHLRQAGPDVFASTLKAEPRSLGRFIFLGRVIKRENAIFVWAPDMGRFRRLVAQGQLRASSTANDRTGDVVLESLGSADLAMVSSPEILFQWDKPTVLVRPHAVRSDERQPPP